MILLLILHAHSAKKPITALIKLHEYFSEKSGFFCIVYKSVFTHVKYRFNFTDYCKV